MDVLPEQPSRVDSPRLRQRKVANKVRRASTPRREVLVKSVEVVGSSNSARSMRKRQPWLRSIEYAPNYFPTLEEFADPVAFMRRIEPEAAKYGICKITVPEQFRSRVDHFPEKLREFVFTVREQKLREHAWDNFGKAEIIYEHPQPFDLRQFQRKAAESANRMLKDSALLPPSFVESEFWRFRNSPESRDVYILYGNDVEGTACDRQDRYNIGSTAWNLQDLGKASWSLLRHAPIDYPGITTPMLYVGSLFSTFFWHVEDHWMHSINYSHYGAIKTWYGVPSSHADAFEKVVLDKVYRRAMQLKKLEVDDWPTVKKCALKRLLGKNTLFLPKLLIEAGVPVYKLDQEPGDFILTFPRGYHAGFSHGFNIGEAVNFALPEWLRDGQASLKRYCDLGVPHILPHQMLLVKEAAALFDRLQLTKRQPDSIEVSTIQQFCSYADEHAQLRYQTIDERGLEEVSIADPLKTQICFACYRQICGCFVYHTDTRCARCMQCSIKAQHITDPDWKLAVPEVVGLIHYLEHRFWVHYGIKAPDHPLSWKIPRRKRSFSHQPYHLRKRQREMEDFALLDEAANLNGIPDTSRSLFDERDEREFKRRRHSIMEVIECTEVTTSNGQFARTVVHDGELKFLVAEELLLSLGAPITHQMHVDLILEEWFEAHARVASQTPPHLIKHLCNLPEGTVLCTLIDQNQTELISQALDPVVQQDLSRFLEGVWGNCNNLSSAIPKFPK